MKTAVVFPGQGSQRAGMAAAWDGHPAAAVFDEVGAAAGIRDLAQRADDPAACASTAVAQPAIFAAGLASWRALEAAGVTPIAFAGHSLGEITAAVAAGVLSVADGARLVAERGRSFAEACAATPGAMAAVMALDIDDLTRLLEQHPQVQLANDNAPGQQVVAGPPEAVDALVAAAREVGARVRQLEVEGAFHTAAMAPAIVRVGAVLRRTHLEHPVVPVVRGHLADVALTSDAVARGLTNGILAPVRWRDVQHQLVELGVDVLLEAGPGGVLTGLARRTIPDVTAIAIAGPDALTSLELREHAGAQA